MSPHVIGLIPFIPVLGAFLTPLVYLVSRSRLIVFVHGVLFTLITLVLSILGFIQAYESNTPKAYLMGGWPPPLGITYTLDKLTGILALTTSLILAVIMVYSVEYMVDDGYPWYVTLMLGVFSGILGVIMTSDVFNLFVMLEVTGVSSYGLVMYYRHRAGPIVSGIKYAFVGAMGTTLYLLALAIIYNVYGSLNLVDLSLKTHGYRGSSITYMGTGYDAVSIGLIMAISFWTFSIKSGVFPNHFWLPDAHPAAPSPVSAMLSGLMVNTGAVGLYKILYLIYGGSILDSLTPARDVISFLIVLTGAFSAVIGALLMNIQEDVKRMIAYSTVMNTGYIFMSIGVLSPLGILAFLYYTVVHSLAKSTLFLSTGLLIKYTGSRRINDLAGSFKNHIIPGVASIISLLTLSGIPPLPGFLGKLLLYNALFSYNPVFAIVMLVASAIGLLAYMRLFFILVFEAPTRRVIGKKFSLSEASTLAIALFTSIMGILLLFRQDFFDALFMESVNQVADVVKYMEQLASSLI
jgi:multicomponent Na+:H+ antiporter subunit D